MGKGRLVVAGGVFLASLAALAASAGIALWGTTDELAARDQLRAAAVELAAAAREPAERLPLMRPGDALPEPENRRLAEVARRVLTNYPGVEGGFYLSGSDQFAGFAAKEPNPPASPLPEGKFGPERKDLDKKGGKKKGDKKDAEKKGAERKDGGAKGAAVTGRREPPPLETPSIRQQCHEAVRSDPESAPVVEVRDVGPSRVAVATAAVGEERPAGVAVWVMARLTGPERQKARLGQLQLATGLSLGGVLLALGLSVGLVRSLRCEERRRAELGDALRKSEYLASLGRLLAGVAHEVRNPLSAIQSTVQLWERLPEQARTPESFAAVVRAVGRLNELVGRLLLFARAGHEARRPLDLNAITAETLELVRARADAQGVVIVSDFAPCLPPVPGAAGTNRSPFGSGANPCVFRRPTFFARC